MGWLGTKHCSVKWSGSWMHCVLKMGKFFAWCLGWGEQTLFHHWAFSFKWPCPAGHFHFCLCGIWSFCIAYLWLGEGNFSDNSEHTCFFSILRRIADFAIWSAHRAFLDHLAAIAWSGHFSVAMTEQLMAAIACSVAALATSKDSFAKLAESFPFLLSIECLHFWVPVRKTKIVSLFLRVGEQILLDPGLVWTAGSPFGLPAALAAALNLQMFRFSAVIELLFLLFYFLSSVRSCWFCSGALSGAARLTANRRRKKRWRARRPGIGKS